MYQEQVMFIVRDLAGFSKGQSDTIRKAMGKKKKEIINQYEEYFVYGSAEFDKKHPSEALNIKGCVNNGIPEEVAKSIWRKMEKFAEYAFNKSHATAYADIGARTAWLSYYYPIEYMCAILNSFIDKADKIRWYMSVCQAKTLIFCHQMSINQQKSLQLIAMLFDLDSRTLKNMGKWHE